MKRRQVRVDSFVVDGVAHVYIDGAKYIDGTKVTELERYRERKLRDGAQGARFLLWFAAGLFALALARACVVLVWQ